MFLFWRAVNLQMNWTVKYQGAFSRIVGFAGKRFLFAPPPPPSTLFFCSRSNFHAITRLERLATQATKLHEFHHWQRLDYVLTTWRMPRRFTQENFTSGRHRRPISLSMLKVPKYENVTTTVLLFSNPKNNSPQSAFYTASISNLIGLH